MTHTLSPTGAREQVASLHPGCSGSSYNALVTRSHTDKGTRLSFAFVLLEVD